MSATMSETQRAACACWAMPTYPDSVWQCKDCHVIRRGAKRLVSVGRVIHAVWPPPERPIDPDVLENARWRGEQADVLFGLYVTDRLYSIPRGTRTDVYNPLPPHNGLLQKLIRWYDKQGFTSVESQVVLAAGDYCGVCDLRLDGMWVDLKSVYDLRPEHYIQIGGYCWLADQGDKQSAALLHCTERFAEPKLVKLAVSDIVQDFKTVKSMYELIKRT